jgi:radical SAM superfamily enzyme YgiQ (UPF0313 family)
MEAFLDLLFIHVPKFSGYYRPYGHYMGLNLIPMGTWALADQAAKLGYRTRMLHLGLEWMQTGHFSALPYMQDKHIRVVAIPLHWHQQSYDVMETAREIKKERPDVFIVTGGYTASYFYKEILANFKQIDAVIRGEAERPLAALLEALTHGRELNWAPNLAWRQGDELLENPATYVASEKDLETGSYANMELLKDHALYMHYMGMPFVWSKELSREQNRKHFHLGHDMFFLNVGRGCVGNCTWCGGGANAQRVVNHRNGVVFRSPERVADTLEEAVEHGYEMIHVAFDPLGLAEPYYLDLFSLIRQRKIRVMCYFESFSVPSERFLQSFAETFRRPSIIAISPESGDEQIRRHNKSFFFTNQALAEAMAVSEKLGIRVDLFFSMGIPGETLSALGRTAALRRQLKKSFKNIGRIWTSPISMEPAAPWFEDPAAFGILSERRTFNDYYRASSPEGGGLGYYIPDFLGNGRDLDGAGFERLLLETKCRDHCSFHPNPAKASSPLEGRIYCSYMNWSTGRQRVESDKYR